MMWLGEENTVNKVTHIRCLGEFLALRKCAIKVIFFKLIIPIIIMYPVFDL